MPDADHDSQQPSAVPGAAAGGSPEPASAAPTEAEREADLRGVLAVIDRLEGVLARSELVELEIEAGGTGFTLRKPEAVAAPLDPALAASLAAVWGAAAGVAEQPPPAAEAASQAESGLHAVLSPLTGIYYGAPSPGADPYVRVGSEVNVGQVIGLIEAMKLFNEIKSDASGRVVRIVAHNGTLVKAKQPLLELEPL